VKKRPQLPKEALEFFQVTGAEGGRERARRLSAKRRSEIAKKAAKEAVKVRRAKAKRKSRT
jgi:hypothetical protein